MRCLARSEPESSSLGFLSACYTGTWTYTCTLEVDISIKLETKDTSTHGSVLALPSPQQSASLVFFGSDLNSANGDDSGIVTQFLVPSGTSSGGDQTTFELMDVESVTFRDKTLSGTETVTSLATFTGEMVASASGFAFEASFSEVVDGATALGTLGGQCQATASNSGECVEQAGDVTATVTGIASTQLIAVSAPTSTPSSISTSSGSSGTSGSSKNGAYKREQYDQKLLVGLVFGTTILGIFSGGFLAL
ncbi:hypothetical protein BT96DRAFT_1025732 [Gymnopus androsaceus JB14]|uniref:Uncharacterized protein n=1 Tax=Gymnopus androsaceus JB14 TaxID=1447944 RepID=A0A6A4GRG2_9AGAR|nr:hypothetical protein BT96DRAFT_1025732 [Gymnopus androsaceus JB14]